MTNQQKLDKAIEKAEQELKVQLSYHSDDRGIPTDVFVHRAPGLIMYLDGISRTSVSTLATDIVQHFSWQL